MLLGEVNGMGLRTAFPRACEDGFNGCIGRLTSGVATDNCHDFLAHPESPIQPRAQEYYIWLATCSDKAFCVTVFCRLATAGISPVILVG
jgi:hypothetical protein